jgi:hypothetical protein
MSNVEDELAIRRVLANYCRGLDRMDKPLSYSVFHADAPVNYHDIYEGTGHGFIDWVWEAHAGMERHSHQISNILVDINGDIAVSEAYVTVALWTLPDDAGKQQEIIGRGRYLDHWEKRAGSWAISAREHVLDMQTLNELNKGYVNEQSRRDEQDRSYTLLKS